MTDINDFLYPRNCYRGQIKPEGLVLNTNLREFAQQVAYITNLETAGKLSPEDAYQQIKALWKQLKYTKRPWICSE